MKRQRRFAFLAILLILIGVLTVSAEEDRTHVGDEQNIAVSRLVDEADLLTDKEENDLLETLDEISERQQCDVVIVTVEGLGGKTPEEYADDFYDYNGYGMGKERDGVLLLISMEERDWRISTCGYGITAFTDAGIEYISEKFLPSLSDGKYARAFEKFAKLCDDFLTQAKTGEPYDVGKMPKGSVSPFWIFGDLGIGLLAAYIVACSKKQKLKSVTNKITAQDYTVDGSLMLRVNTDRFINKTVTQRRIERNTGNSSGSSSRSGGSSTHTSSSGVRHGGGGGKF